MPPKHAQAAATIPSSGPPRLSAQSSDGDLLQALQRNRGLLANLHDEASAAATRLLQNPHLAQLSLGVSEFWNDANWKYRSALPRERLGEPADAASWNAASVAALRRISAARDALVDLAADVQHLGHADMLVLRGDVAGPAAIELRSGIAKRFPGLERWQEIRRISAEAAQARQEDQRARQAEAASAALNAAQHDAARALVRRLAQDGVTLTAGLNGIIAQPASLLSEADRMAILAAKPMLVELLAETATF